ncbi:hypothetical protein C0995_012473 [Termitomyces sp. Mi166|nr:hypothetical protein C0995_012473 [Termitomyces sp. Mi166\
MCSLDDRPSKPRHVFTPTSPRLDLSTCPIGSFNGTELPVPGPLCSPDDRPQKLPRASTFIRPRLSPSPFRPFNGAQRLQVPHHTSPEDRPLKARLIWTRRPQCPFNTGNLPPHVVCPSPVDVLDKKSLFLDPAAGPRDPIIDLGPGLDMIPIYLDLAVAPSLQYDDRVMARRRPLEQTTSFRDSIWFKIGRAALPILVIYVAVRNLIKGSFQTVKDTMFRPRYRPRPVVEQPSSPAVQFTSSVSPLPSHPLVTLTLRSRLRLGPESPQQTRQTLRLRSNLRQGPQLLGDPADFLCLEASLPRSELGMPPRLTFAEPMDAESFWPDQREALHPDSSTSA